MVAPDRYAVLGNPVAHSLSPQIHAAFAQQTGQNMVYARVMAPLDGFAATLRAFIDSGACGVNVTVPFKLQAHALAVTLTERARAAGAVNTLRFDTDGLFGDNTDGIGLMRDLADHAGIALLGQRVLLLGAGGAARGALLALLAQQPGQVVVANRSAPKADELVKQFAPLSTAPDALTASSFEALDGTFDLIINATAASLSDAIPSLPDRLLTSRTLAYDMMYGAAPTPFLRWAGQHGAATRDGLGMLVEQAAEAFFLWRGVRPATAPVLTALRSMLNAV